ncbi:oligo-1,6-glucosidase [Gordoniibacillus kamchatkensis]|uniref:oligo-1,6-glucosidase n=1 Tax=Gordoniibacillus kamchatkensis TaxID=1590651 RepID=A0ABR5ANC4_9BACL|nr:alpha-glucosidase [Paenibacillus sp. VKM B-2647]KIL42499.1 oligo-1,6-glucosidase [Paenibacillus sp. VKM B-2647]
MQKKWWKESVVYQIYPRSFKDSNGDGIGDIQGIISKIDYLQKLGVDVIWLSPVYQSPNDDNGYDISDYYNIMEEFGTMGDFDALLGELHNRGMRLVMDLVVNHTSDEHKWFIESRRSKDNPYRDYYIWRPGNNGARPNNWESVFSGSVWEFDEQTGEYYLHLYSKKQPDLNWENPQVRNDIFNMMHFWLEKGIDGFRMDTITTISKVTSFPDAPIVKENQYQPATQFYLNGPRLEQFLGEMKEKVFSQYDIMTVGETPGATPEEAIRYTNEENGFMDMLFQWEHIEADPGTGGKWAGDSWNLLDFKRVMTKWQKQLEGKGWNSLYLSNHDQPRQVSRFGNDTEYHAESAKMLATCLHMLQGTPFVYQGEEIGMTNVAYESINEYRDIETLNMYKESIAAGKDPNELLVMIHKKSRDNARTPMQWDESAHGGFTSGIPWIQVNPNYKEINVKKQIDDPNSVFNYYRNLIQLRTKYSIIVYGSYELILDDHEQIYAYTRKQEDKTLLVIANFAASIQEFRWDKVNHFSVKELLISNYEVEEKLAPAITLKPYEARVYLLHEETSRL